MFTRWRNSHGFGVHSPFGFQFVERVIARQKSYAYYAYADIDRCCKHEHYSHRVAEEAKMLLRLMCFLEPRSIYLPPDSLKIFQTALKGFNSKLRIVRNPLNAGACDIIASSGNDIPLDRLKEFISETGKSILLKDAPPEWHGILFETMREGIMIQGGSNAIIMSRPQMQKVTYSMYI